MSAAQPDLADGEDEGARGGRSARTTTVIPPDQIGGLTRFYASDFPGVEDLVVVNVKEIAEVGAYVALLEYNEVEGMILLSELSRRRIRSINRLLRVGRNEVRPAARPPARCASSARPRTAQRRRTARAAPATPSPYTICASRRPPPLAARRW